MAERLLIVNADDFGLSPGVNAGVIKAHEHGIVTSASLMVRWPPRDEAAAYARDNPAPRASASTSTSASGLPRRRLGARLRGRAARGPDAPSRPRCAAQLESFRRLIGRDPTHLDSHQHVHDYDPPAAVAPRARAASSASRCATTTRQRSTTAATSTGRPPDGETVPERDHAWRT